MHILLRWLALLGLASLVLSACSIILLAALDRAGLQEADVEVVNLSAEEGAKALAETLATYLRPVEQEDAS